MKIAYEKHPVSKERKAELRGKGFKIIDARFEPNRSDEDGANPLPTREDIAKMAKAEVVSWLKAHGVEAPDGGVAELREQLTAITFAEL